MIRANKVAAKVTFITTIRKHQSEENTAAITHKKQADRVMTHQKKQALNNAYFNCSKISYPIY